MIFQSKTIHNNISGVLRGIGADFPISTLPLLIDFFEDGFSKEVTEILISILPIIEESDFFLLREPHRKKLYRLLYEDNKDLSQALLNFISRLKLYEAVPFVIAMLKNKKLLHLNLHDEVLVCLEAITS